MKNELLRHTLSTIRYRFKKSVADSNEDFGEFSLGNGSRNPVEIINHMYQVLNWSRSHLNDELNNTDPEILALSQEIERFNAELICVDKALDNHDLTMNFSKKLIQGPFSDILTHIGQISMMQRLNNRPISREDFSVADIKTGVK